MFAVGIGLVVVGIFAAAFADRHGLDWLQTIIVLGVLTWGVPAACQAWQRHVQKNYAAVLFWKNSDAGAWTYIAGIAAFTVYFYYFLTFPRFHGFRDYRFFDYSAVFHFGLSIIYAIPCTALLALLVGYNSRITRLMERAVRGEVGIPAEEPETTWQPPNVVDGTADDMGFDPKRFGK